MAVDFDRLARADVDKRILAMAVDDRQNQFRLEAIGAVNGFNELQTTPLTEDGFVSAVATMAAKLDVAIPVVPADLSTLTDAQARTLAKSMELAEWDYYKRINCLNQNQRFWRKATNPPTAAAYLAMFLRMANYVRSKRGLADLT